jgi:4-hydroxybenzoyl-CoA thioesterase
MAAAAVDAFAPFFTRTHRIEWGQCDPAGIVFAPRYFDMVTENTIMLFEAAGVPPKRTMLDQEGSAGYPAVELSARFFRPTSFGDIVTIESAAPAFGNSSFTIVCRISFEDRLCVEVTEKRVWTVKDASRPGGMRSERVPDHVRNAFARSADITPAA